MFEVIISHVRTGRVQRGVFATRDEAERYRSKRQEGLAEQGRSLRDYRFEIKYREPAVVLPLAARGADTKAA